MSSLPNYDAYLERPYQARHAQDELAEWVEEQLAETVDPPDGCNCTVSEPEVEVTSATSWRRGRYGGWEADYTVTCRGCGASESATAEDDNVDGDL